MNRTALITGASRGIGRAIAIRFAKEGYDLVLTCIHSVKELKELAGQLEEDYKIHCLAIQADMGSYEEVGHTFDKINELDVLVNNAGISYVGLLSDMSAEEWQNVMHTNLDSCFYTCRLAIPLMLRKHRGHIINISSVWGSVGASMEVAYSASKGAVNAFTKALAKELAPSNIQVNAVACGLIDTDMNSHLTPEDLTDLCEEIPADRIGTPDEVADLVLQVANSPAYLTGQVITIDGGWR